MINLTIGIYNETGMHLYTYTNYITYRVQNCNFCKVYDYVLDSYFKVVLILLYNVTIKRKFVQYPCDGKMYSTYCIICIHVRFNSIIIKPVNMITDEICYVQLNRV